MRLRNAFAVLAVVVSAACDEVGGPPPPIEGRYELALIGNNPIPFSIGSNTTVVGAELEVNADGTFTDTRLLTVGGNASQAVIATGTWTRNPQHAWQFIFSSPARTDTATPTSSTSLSLRSGGRDWFYSK